MKIEIMVLGKVGTNCYIAMNEQSKEAIIIDPASLSIEQVLTNVLELAHARINAFLEEVCA